MQRMPIVTPSTDTNQPTKMTTAEIKAEAARLRDLARRRQEANEARFYKNFNQVGRLEAQSADFDRQAWKLENAEA